MKKPNNPMRRITLSLLVSLLTVMAASAKQEPKVLVAINVLDAYSELPVEGAKVSVADSVGTVFADSLAVRRQYSSRQAYTSILYEGKVPALNSYNVTVAAAGYAPMTLALSPGENKKIYETFYMRRPSREKTLNEVTVTATRVKMIMKGDTIEYDATAFQLPEGSMLDALIRALPGATLDDNGRISVNGQFVESLLLNGQDFFKGDPQVALQNLPAYTVKNIQVYRRTPMKYMLIDDPDRDRSKDPLVLDVNLKKEYLGGWLANAEFGGGSGLRGGWNTRWMGRLFGMYFNKISYFAVHASANNLNDSEKPTSRGDWYRPDVSAGETTTKRIGMEYNTKWSDRSWDGLNTYVNLVRKSSVNSMEANSEAFMEGGNTFSRSVEATDRSSWRAEWRAEVTKQSKKFGNIFFYEELNNEKGTMKRSTTSAESNSALPDNFIRPGSVADMENVLYNRQQLWNIKDNHLSSKSFLSFSPIWLMSKRFRFNINGEFKYDRLKQDRNGSDRLVYPDEPLRNLMQLQRDAQPSHSYRYEVCPNVNLTLFKTEKSNGSFDFQYEYVQSYNTGRRTIEEINDPTASVAPSVLESGSWAIDEANSYHTRRFSRENNFQPGLSFSLDKLWISLSGTIRLANRSIYDFRNRTPQTVNRRDWKSKAYFSVSYRGFGLTLNYNQNLPDMMHLLEVRDTSNPLIVNLGNPDLKKSEVYDASVEWSKRRFNDLNTQISVSASYSQTDNAIAMARTYDRLTGVTTWRPMNINGNRRADAKVYFFTRLVPDDDVFMLENRLTPSFNRSVDFSSDDAELRRLSVNNWEIADDFRFTYSFNSRNQFSAKMKLKWNRLVSLDGVFEPFSYLDVNYGVSADTQLPKSFAISTDMMAYTRTGYADASMNRTDFVWNLSVAKSFGRDKAWTVKAVGFDILRQLPTVVRTVNAQGRSELRYNSQPAYALLTVAYRLSIQPRKGAN